MMINGKTVLAGVIGWPVAHSRSPMLHNHWCKVHQINGAYVPLPVAPGQLEVALRGLAAAGFRGVNVTIPHKEEAFRLCDELTMTAKRAGAANTLRFEDGRILGDCTDGTGFCDNLRAHAVSPSGFVLILGAGGAARAIAAALQDCGCDVFITNRTAARAEALVSALGAGAVLPWADWPARLGEMQILINATSLGMGGHDETDWPSILQQAQLGLSVADIVYTPLQTPLLRAAQQRGLRTVEGLGMLLYQARAGFHAWFGLWPEVDKQSFDLLMADLT